MLLSHQRCQVAWMKHKDCPWKGQPSTSVPAPDHVQGPTKALVSCPRAPKSLPWCRAGIEENDSRCGASSQWAETRWKSSGQLYKDRGMEGSFHCSRNDLLPPKSQPTLAGRPPPPALPVLGMCMTSPSPTEHTDLQFLKVSTNACFLSPGTLLGSFWTVIASLTPF